MLHALYYVKPSGHWHRLGTWLLALLLGSPGLAHGQAAAPFTVGVTPATTPVTLPAGGSLAFTASAVYPAFATPGFDGTVYALLVQADGSVLVGGSFTKYGTTNCNYLVRLTAAGALDPGFNASLNGPVKAIAVQPDGSVLVGGLFTGYGTNTCNYVARLSPTGGYDASFAANGSGLNDNVAAVVVQPDGKVQVGGAFSQYGAGAASRLANRVARLTATGKLDKTFRPDTVNSSNPVTAIALQADGRILLGSNSDDYPPTPGATLSSARNYISRLNPNGSLDAAFVPHTVINLTSVMYPTYTFITSLVVQPDGNILIGGYSYVRSSTTSFVRRLDPSGTTTMQYGVSGNLSGSSYDVVTALAVQADGKILVGQTDQNVYLRRLNPTGTLDGTLVSGSGVYFGSYVKGQVNALAVQPNGQILLGGTFTNYDSTTVARIARLMPASGKLNTATVPVPGATYTWSNGSNGPALTAVASGTYSATATAAGLTATSNTVVVNGTVAPFTVRITPTGSFNLCAGTTQALTAAVQGTTQAATYSWWKVGTALSVGAGASYTPGTPGQYFATALVASATAASATVTINTLPTPTIANSVSGLPGASVVLTGTNFQVVTRVSFGAQNAAFVLNSPTQLTATVPVGATSGDISLTTACTTITRSNGFSVPAPTISSFSPTSGLPGGSGTPAIPGTSVVVNGGGFVAGATAFYFSGPNAANPRILATSTVSSGTQLTAFVPAGASTGPLTVVTPGGTASSTALFTVNIGTAPTPITGNITLSPTGMTHGDLIIAAPGIVTIQRGPGPTNNLIIFDNLEVRDGATLNLMDDAKAVGGGTFSLAAGATLNVGHPNGLSLTSGSVLSGAVDFGRRVFSSDASYGYIGSKQITGSGLPSRVRNLRCATTDSLKLTQPVSISRVLTMAGAGNLYLNNQMLTLLSGADGTALVHNQGAGVVVGAATVQRYIDPTVNPTAGFRYYGSPVRGATAATFKVPAFAYDQRRSLAFVRQDTLPDISVGFVPTPLAAGAFLEVGRGYRAAVAATDTVRFVGTLTTGNDTVNLVRSSRKAYSGWNLVSNPYPSPLNWNKVDSLDRRGLEAAIYVYESTGPGKGYFRSYVYKKLGTGDSLIAAGQAFFVRVRQKPGTQASTGQLIFRNSQRVSTFDSQTQPTFNRTALFAVPELEVVLERNGNCRPCRPTGTTAAQAAPAEPVASRVTVYTNPAATPNFDPLFDADAGNLINLSQQTLGIRIGGSTRSSAATDTLALLAVQAVPPFSPARVTKIPLVLGVTAPGTYTLGGTGQLLTQLPNGTTAYLRDSSATTNNWITLPTATPYAFLLTAAELLTQVKPVRFWLHFGPAPVVPLASAASAALQSATVYPNPAREQFSVWVPGVAGATAVQATLLSTLGQVVQQQVMALPTAGTTLHLSVPGKASGMYLLRLQAGSSSVIRRVVLE